MQPRTCLERRQHAEEVFGRQHGQVWVATARESTPHLIPMSYAALGTRIILCTSPSSPTGKNLAASRTVKAAFGTTDDLVLVTADVAESYPRDEAPAEVRQQFSGQADWDPTTTQGEFSYFVLHPSRIDVWGPQVENDGRQVMREGEWLC